MNELTRTRLQQKIWRCYYCGEIIERGSGFQVGFFNGGDVDPMHRECKEKRDNKGKWALSEQCQKSKTRTERQGWYELYCLRESLNWGHFILLLNEESFV